MKKWKNVLSTLEVCKKGLLELQLVEKNSKKLLFALWDHEDEDNSNSVGEAMVTNANAYSGRSNSSERRDRCQVEVDDVRGRYNSEYFSGEKLEIDGVDAI